MKLYNRKVGNSWLANIAWKHNLLIGALSFQVNYYQLNFSPRFKLKIVPIQDSFQFRIEIIPRSIWHVNYFYGFRMTRGLSMMLMMMGQSDLRLIRHGLNDKIKWIICGLRLNNFLFDTKFDEKLTFLTRNRKFLDQFDSVKTNFTTRFHMSYILGHNKNNTHGYTTARAVCTTRNKFSWSEGLSFLG